MSRFKKSQDNDILTVRNDVTYQGVSEASINIVETLEKNNEEVNKNTDLFNVSTVKTKKRKTQSDVDREIVEKFYENPTRDNFSMIWKRFYYGVFSFAHKIISDTDTVSDCVQDTFEKAWTKQDTYDPKRSNYSTWLYAICKNVCMAKICQNKKDRCVDMDITDLFSSYSTKVVERHFSDEIYLMPDENGVITANSFDDVTEKIYNASVYEISQFDDKHFQDIMYLKNVKGLKLKEIAQELNMNESKVKNSYYRNRDLLEEIMKTKYADLYAVYEEALYVRDENAIYGA